MSRVSGKTTWRECTPTAASHEGPKRVLVGVSCTQTKISCHWHLALCWWEAHTIVKGIAQKERSDDLPCPQLCCFSLNPASPDLRPIPSWASADLTSRTRFLSLDTIDTSDQIIAHCKWLPMYCRIFCKPPGLYPCTLVAPTTYRTKPTSTHCHVPPEQGAKLPLVDNHSPRVTESEVRKRSQVSWLSGDDC